MSELKVTFKLDGVAEEAAKAYSTIQNVFKAKPSVSFDDWLKGAGTGGAFEKAGKDAGKSFSKGMNASIKDQASFLKNISMLAGPVFNPGGVLSTMFSARQTFSALMTQTGQAGLGKAGMGQGIGAAAAGTIGLTAGATAVGFALKALQKTVEEMMKSFQHAKDLYAKSLTSGLGAGFVAKRENLAAVLGVSEQDVMKFGAAIAYINPKIENATKIFKDTLGPLTELQWDINILKINFMAFASDLGSKLAPAFKTVISQLESFIKLASETEVLYYTFQFLIGAFKGIEIAIGSLVLGFQLIGDTFTFLIHNIINLLASIPGAEKLGIHKIDTSNDFSGSIAGADALNKLMFGSGKSLNGIPLPESHMKQLPASTWEKMGLVVGSGGQGTNDLIRKSNGYLKSIADHVKAVGSVPRSFGLDPKTANP